MRDVAAAKLLSLLGHTTTANRKGNSFVTSKMGENTRVGEKKHLVFCWRILETQKPIFPFHVFSFYFSLALCLIQDFIYISSTLICSHLVYFQFSQTFLVAVTLNSFLFL
ncbi:hypothetical protein I3760_05G186500 [Carya illinoinensis]|nr:hypothetical protein I3760_05G186500 [Carya illinoinensis]